MVHRSIGTLVSVIGILLLIFAVLAMFDASSMSELVRLAFAPAQAELESARWLRHWYFSCLFVLALGFAVLVSGVGIFLLRRKAMLILAGAALFAALFDPVLYFTGMVIYPFEEPELIEITILLVISVVCVIVYQRWPSGFQSYGDT